MKIVDLIPKSVSLDSAQLELVSSLEKVKSDISRATLSKLLKSPKHKGAYIYGAVGRGKTIIVKAFYDSLKQKKNFYHYQEFVKYLHEESHKLFLKNQKDPVLILAKKLSFEYQIICIDEVEIRDITDAMLIQRICLELARLGVFLVFTSNIKPTNLYQNGLQRELFLKFINFINDEFFVFELNSEKDYRFSKILSNKKVITYPVTDKNLEHFKQMLASLTHNNNFSSVSLVVFGRELVFERCFSNVLYSNEVELFKRELSYNDYLSIAQKFSCIVIDNIKSLGDSSDIAIRFINFIDNIYANKVMLVAMLEVEPEKLYTGTKYKKEFGRAVSRIQEMKGLEYITSSKYYRKNE